MRRLILASCLLSLMSCKTSTRSKLDSAFWSQNNRTTLIYFENNTFVVSNCETTNDIKIALENAGDLRKAKTLCKDVLTPISPSAMTTSVSESILKPADETFLTSKSDRIDYLNRQAEELNAQSDALQMMYDDATDEGIRNSLQGSLNSNRERLKAINAEVSQLVAAKNNPEALKKIDIMTTMALQEKIATSASDQARIFVDMLSAVKLYRLVPDRDTTLINAILRFQPTCDKDMRRNSSQSLTMGVETIEWRCDANGSLKTEVKCSLPGYELISAKGSPSRCMFTGRNLPLDNLVATNDAICGITKKDEPTCWGRPGKFPMSIDNMKTTKLSGADASLSFLSSSSQQLCTFNKDGATSNCWPNVMSMPDMNARYKVITGGEAHMCGLTQQNEVRCWGSNAYKQLEVKDAAGPYRQISTLENVTCGVLEVGKVNCWGEFFDKGAVKPSDVPQRITAAHSVSVGGGHICALNSDGTVVCWGESQAPITVPSDLPKSLAVFSGRYESCVITNENNLRCWGSAPQDKNYKSAPQLNEVKSVFTSKLGANFCAIHGKSNEVACWGSQKFDTTFDISAPKDLKNVSSIAITTSGYACATLSGGDLKCWGNTADIQARGNANR